MLQHLLSSTVGIFGFVFCARLPIFHFLSHISKFPLNWNLKSCAIDTSGILEELGIVKLFRSRHHNPTSCTGKTEELHVLSVTSQWSAFLPEVMTLLFPATASGRNGPWVPVAALDPNASG